MTLTSSITETTEQRKKRLMSNAAEHRLRVKTLPDGSGYLVPSQQRGPDGKPVADYHVTPVVTEQGAGWYCPCAWGQRQGSYIPGVTDRALCSHAATVIKHEERAAREAARAVRRLVDTADRIARGKPETMGDRRALAGISPADAWRDLFGPVVGHNVPEGSR